MPFGTRCSQLGARACLNIGHAPLSGHVRANPGYLVLLEKLGLCRRPRSGNGAIGCSDGGKGWPPVRFGDEIEITHCWWIA